MTVRNNARAFQEDPGLESMLLVAESMGRPTGAAILRQEAEGGEQLLHSDLIPVAGCDDDALTELGFDLGDVVDGDPLFLHATLPAGWTRQPSEDPRLIYLADELGRRRYGITYKAAFYDRKASMYRIEADQ